MISNMAMFGEDRDLCLEDLEWNVDSMFCGDSPSESGFDLSRATQDFLESDIALHTSSGIVMPPIPSQQKKSKYISPRGIVDNVEQENSCDDPKESSVDTKQASSNNPGTSNNNEGNRPQRSSHPIENILEPEATDNSSADRNNISEGLTREKSSKCPSPVKLKSGASSVQANEDFSGHNLSNPRQHNDLPQEQIPSLRDDLDTAFRTDITFRVNEVPNEFPAAGLSTNNVTSDPIEPLMHLPGHVQFIGDFDPILQIQSIGTAAEEDDATQDLLHLSLQVPHQDLMVAQVQATPQVDLASNVVISNYEPSNYGTDSEHMLRENRTLSISDVPAFLHEDTGIPGRNNVTSSSSLNIGHRTLEEGTQDYQSTIHANLQSTLTSDYGPHASVFDASFQVPFSTQSVHTHRFLGSAGASHSLPVRSAEGIVKRRGRKKCFRDPTKPPPTPWRRKRYAPWRKDTNPGFGLSPDRVTSGTLQRNYTESPVALSSSPPSASGSFEQCRPQSRGRTTNSVDNRAHASTGGDIQPASGVGQSSVYRQSVSGAKQKDAPANTAKAIERVDSGRNTKKPGRKGGRINPETAHLSAEERRSLRAKRNRESAEKSRVRRKIQTAELEMSVAQLREENKSLRSETLEFQAQLSTMSMEVTQHATTPAEQQEILQARAPALLQSLMVIQRVINECPRTFRPQPHSPEIQLKIRR